jgi:hypothetical protein
VTYLIRFLLAFAWLFSVSSTVYAALNSGFANLMPIFIQGFNNPWGAAINIDFSFHLLLASLWLIWTAKSLVRGLAYGLIAFMFGGSFTFAYLLVQSFVTKGDPKALLLGRHFKA